MRINIDFEQFNNSNSLNNNPKYRLGPVIYSGVDYLDSLNILRAGDKAVARYLFLIIIILKKKIFFTIRKI